MEIYKNPIRMREDHLSCPLPLTLESYWTCEADCVHCIGRRLNHIWGNTPKKTDPEAIRRKLINSTKRLPKSFTAQSLYNKKPFFIGRKTDPYQPIELTERVTSQLIQVLFDLDWPFVIRSKYPSNMEVDTDLFLQRPDLVHILIEITPGLAKDWSLFEHERTTPIPERFRIIEKWLKLGLNVGVRGEPFIPGYHTPSMFARTLKLLKKYGIYHYNTYNLHLNEYNAKRLLDIGLDIERIWEENQDQRWRETQHELCAIANQEQVMLGCPDFVNTPKDWTHKTNTCCGIDVKNAFTYNTHNWRNLYLQGLVPAQILDKTWEGIGTVQDIDNAETIVHSRPSKDLYTFKDSTLNSNHDL